MEKIRLGIIGGGIGSYIGKAHRIAACMDENYTLIGGIFSSTYQKSLELANNLNLDTKRIYEDIDSFIKGELALPEKERIEAVTIAVPNHLHYEIAKKLIENKFHVICEKPVTNTSLEAVELEELVKKNKVIFCLTHTYTGYPMVRQLKKLIEKDMIGKIQRVHAQYYEGCWNPFIHDKESRKGIWRFDPKKTGISCTMADIGVHAFNLIEYVTGLKVTSVLSDLNTLYDDNPLDVDGTVLLRLGKNIKGFLAASQIATGEENNLQIKIYGSKAGLRWEQINPTYLYYLQDNKPLQVLKPGYEYTSKFSVSSTRIAPGHPEGFFEAFANLYKGAAKAIRGQKIEEGEFPTIHDGVRGIRFIEAVVKSSKEGNIWVNV